MERLRSSIRDIPDFPKPGIVFKDITPLLQDPDLFKLSIEKMADTVRSSSEASGRITRVVAIESRGFIFGAPLALELGAGLVIVRKPNKLPYQTESLEYALEYGTDKLEMHVDALGKDDHVVIVDDLLATGGTAAATATLVEKMGASVEALLFLTELSALKGRDKLSSHRVISLLDL